MTTLIPKYEYPSTGSINRPINEKLQESFSVLDFGAVADGNVATDSGTDNLAAFNAAINAAVSVGNIYWTPKVRVPAGVYFISNTITLPPNICFEGDGASNTVLIFSSTVAGINGISIPNVGSGILTTVSGMNISNNYAANTGAGIYSARNSVYLNDLHIGGWQVGVQILDSDTFLSEFICDTNSVHIFIGNQAVQISNGTTYGGNVGVQVSNAATGGNGAIHIDNVRVNGANFIGFYLSSAEQVNLTNCSLNAQDYNLFRSNYNGAYGGIWIYSSFNININGFQANLSNVSNPSITTTTSNGIQILNSNAISINNGIITGWQDGVNLNNSNNCSISNVYSSANLRAGIFLQTTSIDNNFSSNVFSNNKYGIWIQDSSANNTFVGNQVQNNSTYGITTNLNTDINYEVNNIVINTVNFNLAGYTWRSKLNGHDIVYQTAAPTTGTWYQGDRIINSIPQSGIPKSWVCTATGSPGTWVSEGNL